MNVVGLFGGTVPGLFALGLFARRANGVGVPTVHALRRRRSLDAGGKRNG